MLQAIKRWLQQGSSDSLHLVVEGTIVESGTHDPLTHLGPEAAPTESWFSLQITSAQLSDGTTQRIDRLLPPEFAGPLALHAQFAVGDCVRITTTTATGRQIHEMELLVSAT
jgi:hypothetical protein